jgi:hypothetical protein
MRFTLLCGITLFFCLSLSAQTLPEVAPGLQIPNGSGALPLALDHFDGKPELVPVHHSTIEVNNHKGANVAGSLAGSFFYKPKMTTEVSGLHARTAIHDTKPSFYVHVSDDADSAGDSPNSNTASWGLVRANIDKDRRVFSKVLFTQLTGNAKRIEGLIDVDTETISGGWLKMTPKNELAPGEYALMPILKAANTFSTVVFDFSLDATAPNAVDAVVAKP